jgi:hypothetical protein
MIHLREMEDNIKFWHSIDVEYKLWDIKLRSELEKSSEKN